MFGPAMTMTADAPVSAAAARRHRRASGSTPTPRSRPAAASCRSPTASSNYVHALQWGDRARAVPAQPRPVADRAVHRSSQRRLVPQLSAAHPPADGPRLPQRAARRARTAGDRSAPCCSTTSTASTRSTRSRSSRAPARRDCSACAHKGHLGVGADADVTIYDDRRRPRGDVRRAALRDQGRRGRREDGELRDGRAGHAAARRAPRSTRHRAVLERCR